ncbi:Poly(A)-specific ribonuclease [Bertholletia excelsa]
MKPSSSPSLRFLAAATASPEAVSMSSRPPYRGGRNQWRRGFSDRPSGAGDGRGQFVTGDEHFRSVRDANRGFRPPRRPNFVNQGASRPHFNPRPPQPFNSPPSFNPPPFNNGPPPCSPPPRHSAPLAPPSNHGQQFHPPPFFSQNEPRPPQQVRPRTQKPLDYRNWEFAKPGPAPYCERFTVLSYNILADYLAINHRSKLYFHIPQHMLAWEWRKRSIIFELGLWSADILCFQEVDRFRDLEEALKLRGYNGIWKMRTGDPVDGCAIFWRLARFKLLHEESIEFNKVGLRDNVAQICVLESVNGNKNNDVLALPPRLSHSNKVVICNIHVLYNPKRGEIKLGQVRVLLDRAHAISKLWDDAPVVLCGDFNCTPKSPLYNYISEQKLSVSDLPRDKVSGQASAEICPPRPFSPNFRARSPNGTGRDSSMVDQKEREIGSSEVNTGSNVFDRSSTMLHHDNENGASSYKLTRGTHVQEDASKDEVELTLSSPVSGLKETSSSSQSEGSFSTEQMENGHEVVALDSYHEDICPSLIGSEINQTHQSVYGCNDENLLTSFDPSNTLEERASPQNESISSVTERKDGHGFCTTSSSFQGYSDSIEPELTEKQSVDVQCHSSSEHCQPNLQIESENIDQDSNKLLRSPCSADAVGCSTPIGVPNSDISPSELLHGASVAVPQKVSAMGSSEDLSSPSTLSEFTVSYESTNADLMVDEKMENLSFNEFTEINDKDESSGEHSSKFSSDVLGPDCSFSTDLNNPGDVALDDDSPGMDSEPTGVVKFAYDPSAWTSMEIETATGDADCTVMEHSLKLRSTYSEVEDCSGTRDLNGEPIVTSYNRCFLGTVDYIWRSEGLQTVKVLAPIPKHAMQWTPGYPTKKWGSDHIALVSELAFTKDSGNQNAEAP